MAALDPDRGPEIVVGLGAGGEEEVELLFGRAAEAGQGRRDPGGGGVEVDRELEISVGRRGIGAPGGIGRAAGAATGAAAASEEGGGDGEGDGGCDSGSAQVEKERPSWTPVAVEGEEGRRSGGACGSVHWPRRDWRRSGMAKFL